jgi:hypothetical protein
MRNGGSILLALGLTAWIGGAAQGQPGGPQGNRFRDPATLVQNPAVKQELQLTDEQRNKVSTIPSEIRLRLFHEHEKLKDLPPKEREPRRKELMAKAVQTGAEELAKVLTPGQMKRLKQIALQQSDVYAFSEAEVVKALQLTAEQQQRIKTITEEGTKKLRELLANVEDGDDIEKIRARSAPLRKEIVGQAVAVLSDGQKKLWTEMIGEPFDFKVDRPSKGAIAAPAKPIESIGAKFPRDDLSWVEKRVMDLQPTKVERGFDQIAWFRDLREAVRVGKEHHRPVFLFTHNGSISAGRC